MNIFSTLRQYASKWQVTNQRNFTDEEKASVKEAFVVESEYGNSVCFLMTSGSHTYIPLSQNSTLGVGENVDLDEAKLLTLSREGDDDILRVEI